MKQLSPKTLRRLYIDEKFSSPKIAKLFRCDPKNIRGLLRKYKIRIRTKSEARRLIFNIQIPKTKLKRLYQGFKLSSVNIAKKFRRSPGLIRNRLREYGIPLRSIQEALPLSNQSRYPLKAFSENLSEKAYLIGLAKGDLHVETVSEQTATIFVQTSTTKEAMLNVVEESFKAYGVVRKTNPSKRGETTIRVSLNKTFNFLLDLEDCVESWILNDAGYFAAFLAGYSDAEGSFCLCGGDSVFSIRSQDKTILSQIREKLVCLEILLRPPQIVRLKGAYDKEGTISNEDIWGIWVHRKDALLKLFDLLKPYMKHGDKIKAVEILRKNIGERNIKYNRLSGSRFDKLYLAEGILL